VPACLSKGESVKDMVKMHYLYHVKDQVLQASGSISYVLPIIINLNIGQDETVVTSVTPDC